MFTRDVRSPEGVDLFTGKSIAKPAALGQVIAQLNPAQRPGDLDGVDIAEGRQKALAALVKPVGDQSAQGPMLYMPEGIEVCSIGWHSGLRRH
jgi:hypothetical protein